MKRRGNKYMTKTDRAVSVVPAWRAKHCFLGRSSLIILREIILGNRSIRELKKSIGSNSHEAVVRHLHRLKRLGLVEWEAGKARTLRAKVCVDVVA